MPIKLKGMETFHEQNPDFDILSFDFHNQSKLSKLETQLKATGVADAELEVKVNELKVFNRLLKLHQNPDIARGLIDRGVVSANHLARIPRKVFIAEHARSLGLDDFEAEKIHRRATDVRNKSMHLWASVRGTTTSPFFRNSPMDTVSLHENFENIPSYQDMFGSLDYWDCEECRSIFGPAAYLVDLLRIIDEYVTKPNYNTIEKDFLFTSRRPDIEEIELTCTNTNVLVPYLQIVNERLFARAQLAPGVDPDNLVKQMATISIYPHVLPFNAPLDQIRVLLDKVGISYGSILSAWKASPSAVAAYSLGLSLEQQKIVTTPLTTAADVAQFYNVTDITTLSNAETFMNKTWMTFADTLTLLNQDLSIPEQEAGLQINFFLNQELGGKWVALKEKNNVSYLDNLDVASLDKINRLQRLATITGQTAQDIDWALRCVQKGEAPVITDESLIALDQLIKTSAMLEMDLQTSTVLVGPIKTYGQGKNGAGSAFDQIFNHSEMISKQDSYHPSGNPLNPVFYTDIPLSWNPGSDNISAINRVLPGLGIGLSDVNSLGIFLYGKMAQQLTVQTISVLYRHALLSRALQLPMNSYLVLLKLISLNDPKSPTASEIYELVNKAHWLKQTGVSVYHLDYIINGNPSVYVNPLYPPDKVDEWLQGVWTIVPTSSRTAENDIKAQIALLFGIDNILVDSLMLMALPAVQLPNGVENWVDTFLTADAGGTKPKYSDYVQQVLNWISRWLVMALNLGISEAVLANVAAYPAAYQLPAKFDSIDSISWSSIRSIQQIQQMMLEFGDQQQNLLSYIRLASIDSTPIDDTLLVLQWATNWEPSEVKELLDGPLQNESVITSKLADLQTCFDLITILRAHPSFMKSIVDLHDLPAVDYWQEYTQTASNVLDNVASIYGTHWPTIWNQLSGILAIHMRDTLLAMVLSQLNAKDPTIKIARDVYDFLLINVDMGPTTKNSYIKEALNAAQQYLQRCRLRMEPGVEDMTNIKDVWWEWIMNYRVWEANREIFVYPENYLVPNLLSNPTPQFMALTQALQQSVVTKAYVKSSFNTYIEGFAVMADLKLVNAYRTQIDKKDTLYLLSRTKTVPYTFYYCCQQENMPWTSWEKINLTINSLDGTLVYAFNRLFLFWSEIRQNNKAEVSGVQSNIKTNNSITHTVSVMYSFLNQEGQWVQPQTLVNQESVLFKPPDDNGKIDLQELPIFNDLFNMDAPCWNKVFAFNVTAQNYTTPPKFPAEAERLVIMYGPNMLNAGSTVDAGKKSPTNDPDGKAFWENLHNRAEDHNRVVIGQLSGNVNLHPVSVLNFSLEEDVLIQRQELLLVDPYQSKTPLSLIRALMQNSGKVMQIAHSSQPITDNRSDMTAVGLHWDSEATALDRKSFSEVGISSDKSGEIYDALKSANILDDKGNVQPDAMKTLDLYTVLSRLTDNQFGPTQYSAVLQVLFNYMDTTKLFSSVKGSHISVATVGTQPGWFVFFAGDEIFLLSPKPTIDGKTLFSTFAEGLEAGDPLIEPTFAINVTNSIDSNVSANIFETLNDSSLIQEGRLTSNATIPNLKSALSNDWIYNIEFTDDQILYIYNALTNAPIVFDDAFVGSKIDPSTSAKIYSVLQNHSIIDPNGRIYEDNLSGGNVQQALENMLTQSQIADIYQKLAQAPKIITLTYTNQGDAASFTKTSDFRFDVTRLSTGAINKISRALFVGGVDKLLDLKTQEIPVVPMLPFERFAPSTTNLNWPNALDATQVDFDGLYGQYFWEIFYHIPMLVAYSLNINQQFLDAQTWLQYIFNPTIPEQYVTTDIIFSETGQAISQEQAAGIIAQLQKNNIGNPSEPILNIQGEVNPNFMASTDLSFLKVDPSLTDEQILMVRNILLNYQLNAPSSHFWKFHPFRNHTLQTLKEMLSDRSPAVKIYNDDPFDPFAIARLRIGAFEKSTFMHYIDNLIAWGDQLFTQDSWESINAAYMLYDYAYDLLGPRPEKVGECPGNNIALNFKQIKEKYPDGIPQFLIDLEHFIPDVSESDNLMMDHAFNDLNVYFCVPENSNLMNRWDTVQDRMYKINTSVNIKGILRELALFQPPINPLDLVKAALARNNQPGPVSPSTLQPSPYRYSSAISAAYDLCSTLIELGNSLLSALERGDAESLDALRTNQEGQILDMITQIKQDQIDELKATIQSLNSSKGGANERLKHYTDLINNGYNIHELLNFRASESTLPFKILATNAKLVASIAYLVPQAGSPFAMTFGGDQMGNSTNAASDVIDLGAQISEFVAERASKAGENARRKEEWELQNKLAQADVESLTKQIEAANLQLDAAQQDLAVQKKSINQNNAIETYLKNKFTNQDLYPWMVGRLSSVYFQTYALALQAARQAEAAYQFELDTDKSFISFDYFDNLYKGLTSGEGLRLALNRMDTAYRAGDTRRFELEKTISLAMIEPSPLSDLKKEGKCTFSLTEAIFDHDYPGQYARKIKTISVLIPNVEELIGPYQNIKAILTQTKNIVVTQPSIDVVNFLLRNTEKPLKGLRENWAISQSIAISRGKDDDSGMFVLDFQDPRYLPFENTGAVSDWTLSMPLETNRSFDFEKLSDVIINVRYTALFDGRLETEVKQALNQVTLSGGIYKEGGMQS